MTATKETTIRDIVVDNFRTAAVFQRHGLDFCCRGNRPLAEACDDKGIDPAAVLNELSAVGNATDLPRYTQWEAGMLADYITANHHAYVREMLPVLYQHTEKIASVHGVKHPELAEVAGLIREVGRELEDHMRKEEDDLFPYIKTLAAASADGATVAAPPFGSAAGLIAMMEMEHRDAGDAMARIREITSDFIPPSNACTTYRVTFKELEEFESDLHRHVHLENNILFPKAIAFERERSASRSGSVACAVPGA